MILSILVYQIKSKTKNDMPNQNKISKVQSLNRPKKRSISLPRTSTDDFRALPIYHTPPKNSMPKIEIENCNKSKIEFTSIVNKSLFNEDSFYTSNCGNIKDVSSNLELMGGLVIGKVTSSAKNCSVGILIEQRRCIMSMKHFLILQSQAHAIEMERTFDCETCARTFEASGEPYTEEMVQDWNSGMGAPLCRKHLQEQISYAS